MANNIQLAKNYVDLLDEAYKYASVTDDLVSDSTLIKAGANANEIVYPQVEVSGLGDYDRNSGYTDNSVTFKYETAKFNYDRGSKISVDVMDNEETRNLAFASAGGELVRTKAAPEGDAFTFATLAGTSGITVATPTTFADATAFLNALLTAWSAMDELEVPQESRILYANSTLLNSVMALDTTKSREILGRFFKIQPVPQSRFYTSIDLRSGKGEESMGHYKKTEADTTKGIAGGKDINFMIIEKSAIIKYDKHVVGDIIPAALNPNSDSDILKYRKYGIVDVFKNKTAGIYLSHKA